MISFLFLVTSIVILIAQINMDKTCTALSPHVLFQVYFIIQLPLNLFLGTNYYLPRFEFLSPLTQSGDVIRIGSFILFAQIVFVFTVYVFGTVTARRNTLLTSGQSETWPHTRVNLICAGLFALGYVAFVGLILMNGGFAVFAETREAWRTSGVAGQGWVLFPSTTMPAIAMCATLLNNRDRFQGRWAVPKLILLYALAAFPASQLGFRALLFLPLLQAGYFYHSFVRRISGQYILVGSVVVMAAFTLYGIEREIPYTTNRGSYFEYLAYIYDVRPDLVYTVALRSMGADIVQQVIIHMQTFGDYIKLYPSLIEAATIPIPSSLWSDKPLALSVQFSRNIFGIDGGVSPTILGEGYWHGGILGVTALMATAGLLHGYFRSLQASAGRNPSKALLMLSLYPSLIMMAESFQGYFNGIVLIVIANWLLRQAIGRPVAAPIQAPHAEARI